MPLSELQREAAADVDAKTVLITGEPGTGRSAGLVARAFKLAERPDIPAVRFLVPSWTLARSLQAQIDKGLSQRENASPITVQTPAEYAVEIIDGVLGSGRDIPDLLPGFRVLPEEELRRALYRITSSLDRWDSKAADRFFALPREETLEKEEWHLYRHVLDKFLKQTGNLDQGRLLEIATRLINDLNDRCSALVIDDIDLLGVEELTFVSALMPRSDNISIATGARSEQLLGTIVPDGSVAEYTMDIEYRWQHTQAENLFDLNAARDVRSEAKKIADFCAGILARDAGASIHIGVGDAVVWPWLFYHLALREIDLKIHAAPIVHTLPELQVYQAWYSRRLGYRDEDVENRLSGYAKLMLAKLADAPHDEPQAIAGFLQAMCPEYFEPYRKRMWLSACQLGFMVGTNTDLILPWLDMCLDASDFDSRVTAGPAHLVFGHEWDHFVLASGPLNEVLSKNRSAFLSRARKQTLVTYVDRTARKAS